MPTKDQLLAEAERLLKHVNVLDCGAHYCRYCPAKSPDWAHTPFCPYEQSQRDNDAARELRVQIAAALATPDTLPVVEVGGRGGADVAGRGPVAANGAVRRHGRSIQRRAWH